MRARWKLSCIQNPFWSNSGSVLNHVDISSLLSACGRDGNLQLGATIHACIIKQARSFDFGSSNGTRNALFIWNSLLAMYSKCGELLDAVKLFDRMPVRDTVSWNIMISGFLSNKDFETAYSLFKQMHQLECDRYDKATMTTMLSVCDGPESSNLNKMIHGLVFVGGFDRDVSVGNALITSYFKCGCFSHGRQVFDEMSERNVITWTAVMSGLVQNELYEDSLRLFGQMRCSGSVNPNSLTYLSSLTACSGLQALKVGCKIHGLLWKLGMQSDMLIESALMDLYSKCGCIESAWKIFESTEELDVVSLTVILVAFAQNGLEEEAIQIFMRIVKSGIEIDPNMISAVLGVFSVDTSLALAFGRHGDACRALQLYEEMRVQGTTPTDVTFLSLIHACSHAGLVEKGMELMESMIKDHCITPRSEHYACVVDMLGRAGLLKEAKTFIEGLGKNPGVLVWQALLGASSLHGDSEMGKYAADQLHFAAPDSTAPYILMSNIYSTEGKWKARAKSIKRMKEMGVAKDVGMSWIEIENKISRFVVWDRLHPQADIIYWALFDLLKHMKDEGYVPDERYILHHMGQDLKD
ncbi:hypothetical protein QN277_007623 [Acacia crassicarpa]|uniref:Pentatricopeptide repeat-containing protein n=1 Tax=Acacia crassicarpa TaxID=499986 RepID=A0AAE1IXE6_9FABA|nr:hypothetical protein QN277_007623 [Acacia crassicarpa]